LFHNSKVFGSCIIRILYTECAKIFKKCCILYIYSTNIGAEYFKHGIYTLRFFSSKCCLFHNSKVFGSCIIRILYTGVLKFKKKVAIYIFIQQI